MNQEQAPMTSSKPAISKWLWITLIIVVVLAAGFFAWYYLMGPGKTATSTTTTTTPTTATTTTPATTKTTTTATTKTYQDTDSGISFTYPKDWQVIDSLGLPEGSGVTPLTINFAVQSKVTTDAKSLNDLTITIYSRKATQTGYDDLYNSIIGDLNKSGVTTSVVKLGSKDATEYPKMGGLASSPTEVIYKDGENFFVTVTNENSGGLIHVAITDQQFNDILSSFKFTK